MAADRWWREAVCLGAFIALTAAIAVDGPLRSLDLAVARWVEAHRPTAAQIVASVLNRLGQGGWLLAISVLTAAWLAWRIRNLRPLWYVLVAAMRGATGAAGHAVTHRGAPSSTLPLSRR